MLEPLGGANRHLAREPAALRGYRCADCRGPPRREVSAAAPHDDDAAAPGITVGVLDPVDLAAPDLPAPSDGAGIARGLRPRLRYLVPRSVRLWARSLR